MRSAFSVTAPMKGKGLEGSRGNGRHPSWNLAREIIPQWKANYCKGNFRSPNIFLHVHSYFWIQMFNKLNN